MSHIHEATDNDSEPDSGLLPSDIELVKYKQLYSSLSQQVTEWERSKKRTKTPSTSTLGRGIHKTVTLFENLQEVTRNNNLHELAENGDGDDDDDAFLAGFDKTLGDFSNCKQLHLEKSANDARAHDTKELKVVVINFINIELKPIPLIDASDHSSLGLQNGHIGYLICLVDIDWEDEQSDLLVMAFMHVFTSPSSAKCFTADEGGDADAESPQPAKSRKVKGSNH
ncbi:hypothetical protein BDQ17DRAFT_1431261 [Cyathus striatus]|nr:hypothetical protein BDQ17DRAFT_1431261 [Cyathus striatus]